MEEYHKQTLESDFKPEISINVKLNSRTHDSLSLLAQYILNYLSIVNRHPRDSQIKFIEEGHIYLINDKPVKLSCTGLVKRFFPEFNADRVIKNIMSSSDYRNGLSPYSGKTLQEIKDGWSESGKKASDLGSEMHANIEFLMNKLQHPKLLDMKVEFEDCQVESEMNYFKDFCRVYLNKSLSKHLEPYRTEWVIFDESIQLAGSIDMLFRSFCDLPDDPIRTSPDWTKTKLSKHEFKEGEERFWIFDWKRAKEIKTKYLFKNSEDKYIKLDKSYLENCDYDKYSLQLNIYRWILENNYSMKIAGMVLVDIHPNHKTYKTFSVPFLDTEVDLIIGKYKSALNRISSRGNSNSK